VIGLRVVLDSLGGCIEQRNNVQNTAATNPENDILVAPEYWFELDRRAGEAAALSYASH
jgi:hypothetical protein